MHTAHIHSATDFRLFMEKVWDGTLAPGPSGSVIITGSDLYDEYHHAGLTVRRCRATRKGNGNVWGERDWGIWIFPDGSRALVKTDGSAVHVPRQRPRLVA